MKAAHVLLAAAMCLCSSVLPAAEAEQGTSMSASNEELSAEREESMDWEQQDAIRPLSAETDDSLPRVLLLGDSISLGYTPYVTDLLQGKAFVARPACNCGPSEFYLRERGNIAEWLGEERWDVIHVNFGIWDHHFINDREDIFHFPESELEQLKGLDPDERVRIINSRGFHVRTTPEEYESNLRTILADLQEHAGHVIFALSTPVPVFEIYHKTDHIAEYNDIARRVCAEMKIPVNDLYAVALPLRDDQTDGCHFSGRGYGILADAVAKRILEVLKRDRGR